MKYSAIYKDKKGYIFIPMSKTIAGFHMGTEPEIRVYQESPYSEVVAALFKVINASIQGVPTPSFNIKMEDANKVKEKLKKLGIKSFNELNKRPTLHCSVQMENGIITLIPRVFDISMGRGYTSSIDDEVVRVSSSADYLDIYNSIQEAFDKCG